MHAREVSKERETQGLIHPSKGEKPMAKPNGLRFVVEWVVEKREDTRHAQVQ